MVPAKQTIFNSSPVNSVARLFSVAGIFILCFGSAAVLVFVRNCAPPIPDRERRLFLLIWICPGLLFFVFIFLKFVNSGYLLVISPPVFAWLGSRASISYASLRFRKTVKIALVVAFAGANSLVFLMAPVYCSYASVRNFEAELENVVRTLPQIASPADTIIVGFDSHFLGYRHAGYYLPDWLSLQFPEVRLTSGTRVFTMEGRDTRLRSKLLSTRFKHFVLFPLPSDDHQYEAYMNHVRARFPQGALRSLTAGAREYSFGETKDLPLLFPTTATDLDSVTDAVHSPVSSR
jgi:hypothetical protein